MMNKWILISDIGLIIIAVAFLGFNPKFSDSIDLLKIGAIAVISGLAIFLVERFVGRK